MWRVSKGADPDQTLRQRRSGWSGSTLFAYVRRSLFAWRWPFTYQCHSLGPIFHRSIFSAISGVRCLLVTLSAQHFSTIRNSVSMLREPIWLSFMLYPLYVPRFRCWGSLYDYQTCCIHYTYLGFYVKGAYLTTKHVVPEREARARGRSHFRRRQDGAGPSRARGRLDVRVVTYKIVTIMKLSKLKTKLALNLNQGNR